jgi:hypothetical protein
MGKLEKMSVVYLKFRWLVRFSRKNPGAFVNYDVLEPGGKRPGLWY